ncbi:hypothetical protein [Halohasta litorea]|uniref:Imelysin n=1 Tax=Halohasta litorea TaxID=869891 RepID=A0ABD6D9U2_9EURY|nr:hypothetical protein [Halohasta litorea]
MTDPSTTRRGVLTVAGATLLAGCSALDGDRNNEDETISALRLREIVPDDAADPIVADTLPIDIEQSTLAASAQRVDELLADLPIPFGPESVPNGHIRQRLTEAASEATDHVAAARTAPSRLVALTELRHARSEARYAAAGWAFVDRGLTEAELRSELQEIVGEAESFRTDFAYSGSDPVTAALVYGQAERLLDSVLEDGRTPNNWESSRLLTVAAWGDHVESARTQLDDARYLYDRYQSTLPDDAGSVDETLSAATETLRTDIQRRQKDIPPEPDGDDRLRWRLWDDLRDDADVNTERVYDPIGPASGLLAATEGLTALLAADRLGDRFDEGIDRPETTADVRAARTAAVDAITTALDESPRADLSRPMLADAARSVSFADDRLRQSSGDVRSAQLDHPIVEYTAATLRARSVPAACETVLDALDS